MGFGCSVAVFLIRRHQCICVSRFLVGLNGVVNLHGLKQRVCAGVVGLQALLVEMLEDQRQAVDKDGLSIDFEPPFRRWAAAGATRAASPCGLARFCTNARCRQGIDLGRDPLSDNPYGLLVGGVCISSGPMASCAGPPRISVTTSDALTAPL